MSYIELEHISKKIKSHSILNNITISMDKGFIYGFSGPNGCGKSVLFRIIAGLVIPSSGNIQISGKNLHRPKRTLPDSIGIMIDAVGLYPYFNAVENLSYLSSINNTMSKNDIIKVIQRVGLNPNNKESYGKYSLGMKQRLIIAQAIMEKPDIIIFDEPTNSLDESGVDLFREIVNQEKQRGATILISSHNSEDLEKLCDKIHYIKNGEIAKVVNK
ncbi:MAG: ATP-binding cassette domain-containing protein [Oscillospiraceae bacterium]|jgi:ABC-2 type transport system ATP-binding protein|nr:ATP-binding cassette domain-containing protein [Oscillospiraceae bacterium]